MIDLRCVRIKTVTYDGCVSRLLLLWPVSTSRDCNVWYVSRVAACWLFCPSLLSLMLLRLLLVLLMASFILHSSSYRYRIKRERLYHIKMYGHISMVVAPLCPFIFGLYRAIGSTRKSYTDVGHVARL